MSACVFLFLLSISNLDESTVSTYNTIYLSWDSRWYWKIICIDARICNYKFLHPFKIKRMYTKWYQRTFPVQNIYTWKNLSKHRHTCIDAKICNYIFLHLYTNQLWLNIETWKKCWNNWSLSITQLFNSKRISINIDNID